MYRGQITYTIHPWLGLCFCRRHATTDTQVHNYLYYPPSALSTLSWPQPPAPEPQTVQGIQNFGLNLYLPSLCLSIPNRSYCRAEPPRVQSYGNHLLYPPSGVSSVAAAAVGAVGRRLPQRDLLWVLLCWRCFLGWANPLDGSTSEISEGSISEITHPPHSLAGIGSPVSRNSLAYSALGNAGTSRVRLEHLQVARTQGIVVLTCTLSS